MKRLFKFLVATLTALSMLVANTSLTNVVVMADGEEASTPTYTFSNTISGEEDVLNFSGGETTFYSKSFDTQNGTYFPAGNITVTKNESKNASLSLVVTLDGTTVTPSNNVCTINTGFRVVGLGINNDNEGRLELVTENPPASNTGEGDGDSGNSGDSAPNTGEGGEGTGSGDQGQNNPGQPQVTITVTVTANVVRVVWIGGEEFRLCEDQIESSQRNETVTKEVHCIPDMFEIENPGGKGPDVCGCLRYVTINGNKLAARAKFDKCSYELSGLKDGDTLTIDLEGDNTPGGVIEWTNYGCPTEHRQGNISEEEQFKYGSAKVVGIYAENDTGFTNNIMDQYGVDEHGCLDEWGNGGLRLEHNYWIAFEFVPLPGYQLVKFGGGAPGQDGLEIGTTDRPNVYYFQMPAGNCHFSAEFDTPENIVKINGNSIVDDGGVEISEREFAGGTAQMTVGALSSNDQSAYNKDNAFVEELDDNDLEVQEYLSLDLANIYQKANTNEYWTSDNVHELKDTAEVTLKVDEGFNPDNNKVYIVHDLGDGNYETIEAEYDPNRHEISFETGSFSNFMIATSGEENEIEYNPNNNESEPPLYAVQVEGEDVMVGKLEKGQDHDMFIPVDFGMTIPGDAVIENRLPDDIPEYLDLIYYINGEKVMVSHAKEREPFTPEHFVALDGIEVSENTIEIYFTECWVVDLEVWTDMDFSLTVLDKNGKVIQPIGFSEEEDYTVFELSKAEERDIGFELAFTECPNEIVIKGINGFAIFGIECSEEDYVLDTPIGENKIKYPADDDFIWLGMWGFVPESETVDFTESLSGVSSVFVGLSEAEVKNYILTVFEFDTSDAPDEDIAAIKKQLAEDGYTGVVFPLGFDITLYDKNGPVHEPGFTVRITLVLHEELDLKDGETVVILHLLDDGYEIIEAIYNAKNKTITFETKSFSPFVVSVGTKTAAAIVSTGETVDYTRIVIASMMIAVAAATCVILIRKKKVEKEDSDPTI